MTSFSKNILRNLPSEWATVNSGGRFGISYPLEVLLSLGVNIETLLSKTNVVQCNNNVAMYFIPTESILSVAL